MQASGGGFKGPPSPHCSILPTGDIGSWLWRDGSIDSVSPVHAQEAGSIVEYCSHTTPIRGISVHQLQGREIECPINRTQ